MHIKIKTIMMGSAISMTFRTLLAKEVSHSSPNKSKTTLLIFLEGL